MIPLREVLYEAASGPPVRANFRDVVRRGRVARRRRMLLQSSAAAVAVLLGLTTFGHSEAEPERVRTMTPPAERPADTTSTTEIEHSLRRPPRKAPGRRPAPTAPPVVSAWPGVRRGPTVVRPTPPTTTTPSPEADVLFIRDEEVYAIREDGSGIRKLTDDGGGTQHASWSPDGSKIVMSVVQGTVVLTPQIWVLDMATRTRTRIANVENLSASTPRWSPDGRWIVFSTWDYMSWSVTGREPKVWRMDATGNDLRVLAVGHEPSWAPDGKRIVYGCQAGLCTMSRDGSDQMAVPGSADLGAPAWSPDGEWIAANDHGSIALIKPDGTRRTVPGATPTGSSAPSWLSATRLVYDHPDESWQCPDNCGQGPGLYGIDIDGSDERRLTVGQYDRSPDARPRG